MHRLWRYIKRNISFSKDTGLRVIHHMDADGTSWQMTQIGGIPQESFDCNCGHCQSDYDCCGGTFCKWVNSWLGGIITCGHYSINV